MNLKSNSRAAKLSKYRKAQLFAFRHFGCSQGSTFTQLPTRITGISTFPVVSGSVILTQCHQVRLLSFKVCLTRASLHLTFTAMLASVSLLRAVEFNGALCVIKGQNCNTPDWVQDVFKT